MRIAALAIVLVVSSVGTSACTGPFALDAFNDDSDEPVTPTGVQLWTLFDIEEALRAGTPVATTASFPAGFSAEHFLTPEGSKANLRVIPAFSEGEPAAYVATEVWVNFREIWVQPWYFLITAWNDRSPLQNRLKEADGMTNAPPVFDVAPESRFYSPFWKIFYAVVPPGTPSERYRSAEQIFNDGLTIHEGAGWVYSVRPDNVGGDNKLTHPFLGKEIGVLSSQPSVWVDGRKMGYFNQGGSNFRFDDKLVVEEVPLFIFRQRNANGTPVALNAPPVIGSSPLGSRRPAEIVGGRPRYGAYTRLTFALVPATAAPFDPDEAPAAVAALMAKGLDPGAFRGRVAQNGKPASAMDKSCFEAAEFPQSCQWLDAQLKIEDQLGRASLQPTEVTMATAPVFFGAKGIGR